MKYLFFALLMTATFGYTQNEALIEIINSDSPLEIRQQKIDALLLIQEAEHATDNLADFYHDLGSKWYHNNWWENGRNSDMVDAIYYMEKAYKIKSSANGLKEGSLEKTLFNLGYYSYLNGKLYDAIDYYLLLNERGKDNRLIQKGNQYLGELYLTMGDFYKALNHFNRVVSYDKKSYGQESTLIETHINIARRYSIMDVTIYSKEIQRQLVKADSILLKSQIQDPYYTNEINQIEGNRLLEIGEFNKAIEYQKKVLRDSINLYNYDKARVLNSLAYSQLKLEDYDSSIKNLYKAISYDANYTDPYENLGDVYIAQNNFEKGLYFYQKGISVASGKEEKVKFDDQASIESLELAVDKISLLGHIVSKANAWLKYYEHNNNDKDHLTHALKTFNLADQLVDIIRAESTEYQSKLFWREKGALLYATAVEVCYLLNKPEDAFYFMERNKALLLLEDITTEQAKEIAQLPKAMIQREYELKQAIFLAENELQNSNSGSQDTLSTLKSTVYDTKRGYNAFVDSLSTAFPEYAKIKKKVEVLPYITFKEKFVSKDEVVLQYILNDEQGYGLMTSTNKTRFFKLEDANLINEDLVLLYSQLTDMTSNREKMASYAELSNSIFQKLVPEEVYDEINGKKLTIISDYILQQIPFESFVVDKEKVRYLIEDVEIRYAYSMSYLDAKEEINQNPEKEFLGLAPVQFASLGLPDLAFSGAEISEVNKIYDGRIALNKEATKSSLLADLNGYKIVHLSTHADVGEDGNPWIAFSDEKLFLNEIYANKNQAEMVVLSGCNTSLGELKKGEGAMSLARGFFHSGAKSVVSSLWTINDKTSKDLMAGFYKALDQGMTKSAALRKAKIDYIEQYRGTTVSPSFWAALIVIGDNEPLTDSHFFAQPWMWFILGVFLLGMLYVLIKKKRSQ